VIAVVDFGSQYSQLICRRIRELQVPAELVSWPKADTFLNTREVRGVVLSGGPASVYVDGAPSLPASVLARGVPVLGICYGMQLLMQALGGRVEPATTREFGQASVRHTGESALFQDIEIESSVWMSHGDRVESLPDGCRSIAASQGSPHAAVAAENGRIFGLQFHPEVSHTVRGMDILGNFVHGICGCDTTWTTEELAGACIRDIRTRVPADGHVLLALSGGVDSSVAAALVHRAVGERLTCIFVNNGLLRMGEADQVLRDLQEWNPRLRIEPVDAVEDFLEDLAGVADPELKRTRIGHRFIRIFEREAARLAGAWGANAPRFLVQGTIYPDVIESASGSGEAHAQTIKTHHNVGGLPSDLDFELIEPLRMLFKDEVRRLGAGLGLPVSLLERHPFPGPGLAVRIPGEVTWERLETLRRADAIFLEELRRAGLYTATDQAFAVLLPVQSVGVMGDGRTLQNVVALRAVSTSDFMTAEWTRLPWELVAQVSTRIVNEVPGVNRVVLDVSTKPPATIEWE